MCPLLIDPSQEGMVGFGISDSALRGFAWWAHWPVREAVSKLPPPAKNVKPLRKLGP